MHRYLAALISLLCCLPDVGARGPSALFPFVLPWDDASPGVTDLASWIDRPAGKKGPVRASADGHFYIGDRRTRFLGVNFCFGAAFPAKEDAPKIAARLAKFGINVVRFHHMDGETFPAGIRAPNGKTTSDMSPEALERLDYFTAQLAEHGIYSNLNLLVWRPFKAADGLPPEIEQLGRKEAHVVGFFDARAQQAQQTYTRNLLSHRNPYLRRTYAEAAEVAFVEINNENGLIHAWLGGQVDSLPEIFRRDLKKRWNGWLLSTYQTSAKLRKAWGAKAEPLGAEMLTNRAFGDAAKGWVLERHEKAEASVAASTDVPPALRDTFRTAAHIRIAGTSSIDWHIQLHHPKLRIHHDQTYTLQLWARADAPRSIAVGLQQDHDPWQELGLQREARLTTEWQHFRFVFSATKSDDNARVILSNLAGTTGNIWVAGPSLRQGGVIGLAPEEDAATGTVAVLQRSYQGERTEQAQRDWLRFLWEVEQAYWEKMRRFVKDELGFRGVVIGTIVGCSTPNLMARFDAVDTHAYWQHPEFPRRPWDADDWIVANRTMVNEPGGVLPGLALRRVADKPHCVTEYNHSAPNTYGSEGFLLLAAYAALQDWDAIYPFAYSHTTDWNSRCISGFFDIAQHPTKMATLPAAAALFVRGDVRPAKEEVLVGLDPDREIDGLRTAHAWGLVHAGTAGIAATEVLIHRVALVTPASKLPMPAPRTPPTSRSSRYVSDTGELTWDLRRKGRGVVVVDSPRSKAVLGHGGGECFELGGVVIEPGKTLQDGWCTVTVTAMEGTIAGPGKLLLTATGLSENTGMLWKDDKKDSVGRNWGKAPSLVEGVPVHVTLPVGAWRVRAWALDERGQRRTELPVAAIGEGKAMVRVGRDNRALWYEVEVRE
jgi:hypothetical protein